MLCEGAHMIELCVFFHGKYHMVNKHKTEKKWIWSKMSISKYCTELYMYTNNCKNLKAASGVIQGFLILCEIYWEKQLFSCH